MRSEVRDAVYVEYRKYEAELNRSEIALRQAEEKIPSIRAEYEQKRQDLLAEYAELRG